MAPTDPSLRDAPLHQQPPPPPPQFPPPPPPASTTIDVIPVLLLPLRGIPLSAPSSEHRLQQQHIVQIHKMISPDSVSEIINVSSSSFSFPHLLQLDDLSFRLLTADQAAASSTSVVASGAAATGCSVPATGLLDQRCCCLSLVMLRYKSARVG